MTARPRFSFVATSRNDDHGGDALRRTQSFIRFLALQCERHQLTAELILVDWNPPAARAPLADIIEWPKGSAHFTARVVTVPPQEHYSLKNSRNLGMFQMIAKNVGIRRARGDFIIATNIDIVFSDELFVWLQSEPLRDNVCYRSDRWDMPNAIQLEPDISNVLRRARSEAIRRNLRDGTYKRNADGTFTNTTPARIDFTILSPLEWRLMQLEEIARYPGMTLELLSEKVRDLRENFLPERRRFFHIPELHTNGCGDFTMLSRASWAMLRGYPEWEVFSWCIDSVLIHQVHYNGMEIVEAPANAVHFHIEHDNGSGWTPEGSNTLWERLLADDVPYIDGELSREIFFDLQDNEGKVFTVYNNMDWGRAELSLTDELVACDAMPARKAQAVNGDRLSWHGQVQKQNLDTLTLYYARRTAPHTYCSTAGAWSYMVGFPMPKPPTPHMAMLVEADIEILSGTIYGIMVSSLDKITNSAGPYTGRRRVTLRYNIRPDRALTLILRSGANETAEVKVHGLNCRLTYSRDNAPEMFFPPEMSAEDESAVGSVEPVAATKGTEMGELKTDPVRQSAQPEPPLLPETRPVPLTGELLPFLHRKAFVEERDGCAFINADAPAGHALFGPYTRLSPGRYQLSVGVTMDAPQDTDTPLCVVEIVLDETAIATRTLHAGDIASQQPISFQVSWRLLRKTPVFQARISHCGSAGLSIKSVHLKRV